MPTERFYRLPEAKKQVIRQAAIKEFARVPFEKASINQIIQNADISRGSFYTYFEDKQDVVRYIFEDNARQMQECCERELFGYVKGAFTGARSNGKTGLFEAANGGTIFLDEISEIPPNMQARLLRVIQERQVVRIGDDKVIPVDIRILAASNRDLRTLVQQGAFRADLYYRLSVLELKVPPLSWRREDIPLLAQSLLQNKNKALNTHVTGFAPEALEVLQSLEWPGNIRQLSNFIERLMILSDPPLITGENARALAQNEATKELPVSREGHFPTLEEAESNLIRKALDQTGGSRTAAAQLLGIHPSTLWRKLRDFDTEISL